MKLLIKTSVIAATLFSIAACSGDPETPDGDTVTETRMDEVDVLDGTISDDMVNVDEEQVTDELLEKKGPESPSAVKDAADENSTDGSDEDADSQSEDTAETEE